MSERVPPERKMQAMTKLSRAIRGVSSDYAPTLQEVPEDVLQGLAEITAAYAGDFKAEQERRQKEAR